MFRTFVGALVLVMMLLPTFPVHAFFGSLGDEEKEFLVFGPYPSSRERMESLKSAVRSVGGDVLEEFPLLGGVLIEASPEAVRRLSALGYKVYNNSELELIDVREESGHELIVRRVSVHSIGAPSAWAMGLNGSGVRVAVLDTGIYNDHPWFMRGGRSIVVWEHDATGANEVDYCGKGTLLASDHGTHVAGIIASQDATFRGVAPGVVLYDIIVFTGAACSVTTDAIIARGVERALRGPDNRPDSGDEPHIITISIGERDYYASSLYAMHGGATSKPAVIEVLERAASRAVVTVPAGNDGGINAFNSLCLAKGVICVGATYDNRTLSAADDRMAFFSSRGPGFPGMMVPLVSAPGVDIVSASVPEKELLRRVPTKVYSGTSMAASHVAGAAAILIQQMLRQGRPLDPVEVAKILAHTARDVLVGNYNPGLTVSTVADQGAGQINLTAAVSRLVSMDSGGRPFVHMISGSSGSFSFRVTNIARSAVNLEVSIVPRYEYDPDIVDLSRRFSVSPSRLSLPQGGSATITVSFRDLPPGVSGGYVVLRGHGITHRFPFLITVPLVPLDIKSDLPPWNDRVAVMRFNTRVPARVVFVTDSPVLFVNVSKPFSEPLLVVIWRYDGRVVMQDFSGIILMSPSFHISEGSMHYANERGLYMLELKSYLSSNTPVNIAIMVGISSMEDIERFIQRFIESRKDTPNRGTESPVTPPGKGTTESPATPPNRGTESPANTPSIPRDSENQGLGQDHNITRLLIIGGLLIVVLILLLAAYIVFRRRS